MDLIEGCRRTMDGALAQVRAVTSADHDRPTPCSEWNARQLIEHMTGTNAMIAQAIDPGAVGAAAADPVGAYEGSVQAMVAATGQAGLMDQKLTLPFGEMPAPGALALAITDQLIHTWDLARALGKPCVLDADLCETALGFMQASMRPEFRGEGKGFGPEVSVAANASVQDRMLGFSGRDPS
ncbi:MAG: TIGR03086 family metal-binding protein [Chloroflexota bacterium]